jgi:hypothetical protein
MAPMRIKNFGIYFDITNSSISGEVFEVRESLFIGPSGQAANFQSTFQVLQDGARNFVSVIPIQ